MYKNLFLFLILIALLPAVSHAGETIKCASTSPTQQSGMLDYLLPIFKKETGIDIQTTIVGNGDALQLGQEGKVDIVLTHDADLEKQLVDEGFFIDREEIMYNDFVILGPTADPAAIKGTEKVLDAFKKIRTAEASFVSRGDNSGTNMRENRLWAMTGFMPGRSNTWYFSENQGMPEAIRIASKKQAYTVADRATWLSMKDKDSLNLSIVLEKDPLLFNQYGVMIVNPKNYDHINYQSAMNFVIWITSPAGQKAIDGFRDASGNKLFTPNAR